MAMTLMQLIDDLEGKIRASNESLVLSDHFFRARIHEHGRTRWRDLYRHFSKNLSPNRPYAGLAGVKILRIEGKKSIEPWAKNRDIASGRPKHAMPSWAPSLAEELSIFLDTQTVSANVSSSIRKLAENGTCSRETIPLIIAMLQAMQADTRAATAEVNARREAVEIARNNAILTQKLLSFEGANPGEEDTGRSTH